MALNSSIFGNMLNAPKSPEEYRAERQQVEAGALTNALNRQKVDEYQAGIKRQGDLRNLLMGGANADALRRGGFLDEATKLETDALNARKGAADVGGKEFEIAQKRYDVYRKTAGARFNDPNLSKQSVLSDITQLTEMGILTPEVAQRLASQLPDDPQQLRQVVRQAAASQLTPEQMLTAFAPKPEKFDSGGQIITRDMNPNSQTYGQGTGGAPITKVQSPESRASVAAQIRGQNMSAETARRGQDIASQTAVRGQDLASKKAAGGGNVTEGERNASGYASRMIEATKLLDTFEKTGKQTYGDQIIGAIPLVGSALQREGMSADQQSYRQAAEDWVRAKLRNESGAVIGKEEMEAEIATYFPKPGDKPENIQQKKRAREVATQAMIKSGGRGMQDSGGASGQWGDGWTIQEVK